MTPSDPGTLARGPQPAARLPKVKQATFARPGGTGQAKVQRSGQGIPVLAPAPGRRAGRLPAHSEKVLDPGPAPPQP